MKTKFKSNEIAHIFVNRSAPHGESPSAMSFNSDGFYSYRTVIAKHIEHKGKHALLRNIDGYSPSTQRHQSVLSRAIPSYMTVFRIGDISMGDRLNHVTGAMIFDYAVREAAALQDSLSRARSQTKKDYLASRVSDWLTYAKEANEFFGLKRKVDEKTIERLAVSKARAEKKEKKEREALEAKDQEMQAMAYEAWKNGMPEPVHFKRYIFPVAFRVEDEELVSTLGARVPLEEAKKALRFAKIMRERGWRRNGETFQVGPYQLDSISPFEVLAGCHRIFWEEIDRIASLPEFQ